MSASNPKDLAERFLTAFNRVDEYLRAETKLQDRSNVSFNRVLAVYVERHPGWRYRHDLRRFGELRNAMVHEHYDNGRPLAYPAPRTTERIEQIRDALLAPVKVDPKFRCPVATVSDADSVSALLRRLRECDFSQFPVVAGGTFRGLVTENGITRWLARSMPDHTLVELGTHTVAEVLNCEESRNNFTFVPRSMYVDDLIELFREKPDLEAALITERGEPATTLLGIATRWDIVHAIHA